MLKTNVNLEESKKGWKSKKMRRGKDVAFYSGCMFGWRFAQSVGKCSTQLRCRACEVYLIDFSVWEWGGATGIARNRKMWYVFVLRGNRRHCLSVLQVNNQNNLNMHLENSPNMSALTFDCPVVSHPLYLQQISSLVTWESRMFLEVLSLLMGSHFDNWVLWSQSPEP